MRDQYLAASFYLLFLGHLPAYVLYSYEGVLNGKHNFYGKAGVNLL